MTGDKYQVFYSFGGVGGRTIAHPLGPWDDWKTAKLFRDADFFSDKSIRAAWIMRSNPSLELLPEKYGHTMRRNKYEARSA